MERHFFSVSQLVNSPDLVINRWLFDREVEFFNTSRSALWMFAKRVLRWLWWQKQRKRRREDISYVCIYVSMHADTYMSTNLYSWEFKGCPPPCQPFTGNQAFLFRPLFQGSWWWIPYFFLEVDGIGYPKIPINMSVYIHIDALHIYFFIDVMACSCKDRSDYIHTHTSTLDATCSLY